jgi:hypothetical protein
MTDLSVLERQQAVLYNVLNTQEAWGFYFSPVFQ